MSSNMTLATNRAVENGGMVLFGSTGHSTFAVTHRAMFDFLPTDVERQKTITQHIGGIILVYNTRIIFKHVLRWMYLCALEETCIAPIRTTGCSFTNGRYKYFANCHRFDQSLMNILLSNHFGYNETKYVAKDFATIQRYVTSKFKIKSC